MRLLVIGCGKFGSSIIDKLSDRGNDVVAIDTDEEAVANINDTMDAMAVCGTATDLATLREVEAGKVDLCISCTDSDECTLLSAYLAKQLGAKKTIACVRYLVQGSEGARFMESCLNIDLIVNPDYRAAQAIFDIIKEHNSKKVFLLGGSKIAVHLAKLLVKNGNTVGIIDRNEEVCARLASTLSDKVNIVVGDGADHDLLMKEGLADCDAFAALTELDEINILTSLFANDNNIPTVITKLGKESYTDIIRGLNLTNIVSPRMATVDMIINYVSEMKEN